MIADEVGTWPGFSERPMTTLPLVTDVAPASSLRVSSVPGMRVTAAVLPTTVVASAAAMARRPAPPEIVTDDRSEDLTSWPAGT